MGRLKRSLVVATILAIIIVAMQIRWPFGDSLSDWLVKNQNVPADQVPVTQTGQVDFMKLVNENLRENVTVDNNIIVDLYQILDENDPNTPQVSECFLRLLGNPEKIESIQPFVYASAEVFKQVEGAAGDLDGDGQDDWTNDYYHCTENPWVAGEFPAYRKWLESNRPALDHMLIASKKMFYYDPLVTGDDSEAMSPIIGALPGHARQMRSIARALSMRAMNHLAEDRIDDCLADLSAVRHFGFKINQGPTLVEQLVSVAIIQMAFERESQVLSSGKLDPKQCDEYQKTIAETRSSGNLTKCISVGERVMMMDTIQWMSNGNRGLSGLAGTNDPTSEASAFFSPFFDWQAAAEQCNVYYDVLVEKLSIEDDTKRKAALIAFEQELQEIKSQSGLTKACRIIAGARSRGKLMGDVLTSLLMPAMLQCDTTHVRAKMHGISSVGFEIEKYRLKNGQLPQSLEEISSAQINPLLFDRFTGKNIVYHQTEGGYILYSPGPNMTDETFDENGKEINRNEQGYVDDVVIRVRLKN